MCIHNIYTIIVRFFFRKSGFDEGSPDGNDPLVLARQMATRGITLVCFARLAVPQNSISSDTYILQFFVACEPALSSYSVRPPWVPSFHSLHMIVSIFSFLLSLVQFATDFYKALVNITSGIMLPLTTADLLAHAIVGLVLENLDMERLVREVGQAVAQRILGNNESVDDVARELHEKLLLRNESTKKVVIESIYRDSDEARHNVEVFSVATSLAEVRPHLRRVRILKTVHSSSAITHSPFRFIFSFFYSIL